MTLSTPWNELATLREEIEHALDRDVFEPADVNRVLAAYRERIIALRRALEALRADADDTSWADEHRLTKHDLVGA